MAQNRRNGYGTGNEMRTSYGLCVGTNDDDVATAYKLASGQMREKSTRMQIKAASLNTWVTSNCYETGWKTLATTRNEEVGSNFYTI